jgi:hypothetical protein
VLTFTLLKKEPRMSSDKQIAANQRNAQSSSGPHDTGRTSRNATSHGLTAEGVGERDRPHHRKVTEHLAAHFRPAGPVEEWLVDRIGLLMVRIQQAVEIEKAWLTQQIQRNRALGDPMAEFLAMQARILGQTGEAMQCAITDQDIRKLNDSVGRYETALENRMYRSLHELERWQRRRQGENVPAPAAGDLSIHGQPAATAAPGDATGGKGMLVEDL